MSSSFRKRITFGHMVEGVRVWGTIADLPSVLEEQRVEMVMADGTRRTQTEPNLYIFTAKHYSIVRVTDSSRPAFKQLRQATDAEKVAAWTPFTANAGTYVVSGSTVTIHRLIDKTPNVMGGAITFDFKVEGDTLSLIQRSVDGEAIPNPPTLRLTRVE